MKKIVRHENGLLCLLDTDKDECLYDGREIPDIAPNAVRQMRWLEVYFHTVEGADPIYYIAHMTHWQGESSYLEQVEKEKAAEVVGSNVDDLTEDDLRYIEEIGLIVFADLK